MSNTKSCDFSNIFGYSWICWLLSIILDNSLFDTNSTCLCDGISVILAIASCKWTYLWIRQHITIQWTRDNSNMKGTRILLRDIDVLQSSPELCFFYLYIGRFVINLYRHGYNGNKAKDKILSRKEYSYHLFKRQIR